MRGEALLQTRRGAGQPPLEGHGRVTVQARRAILGRRGRLAIDVDGGSDCGQT
jgi:hypothetical protein